MARKWLRVIGLLVLAGCNDPAPVDIEQVPAVAFEIEFTNFAAVATWKGFYIDAQGVVWSYDRSEEPQDPGGERADFSHDELMRKYDPNLRRVRELPLQDVINFYALIPAAGRGELSPPVMRCRDAGQLSFRAFEYDFISRRYYSVVLRIEGDLILRNLAPEAVQIYNWLNSLNLVQHITGCEPS